ncbi:T9SS type A sorting domain-containing protein [Flavobacterium sp.]|uniref:T9SS type A sorting domain-containing protein n=1 Tax=Flavobacterium sp. TaxID=239 RepID=UPI002B4B9471|nr:T9SS type A sorting domain-containing protein [Flavobacterium sp.]HLP63479.1 T9SS type A sorting domain-containing protein [Flavobacterium sp.]
MRKFYILACGLMSLLSFANPTDTEPPVWTTSIPAPSIVECGNGPDFVQMTATDNSGTVTVTYVDQTFQGICPGNFQVNRIWTATDPSGNSITATQTITVQDTTSPILVGNPPLNLTANCSSIPGPSTIQFTDNCSNPITNFTSTTTPVNSSGNYTILRTWIASDLCGNTSSFTQTITVTGVPVINIDSIVQSTCSNPYGTVNLSGLPTGSWVITYYVNNNPLPNAIYGSGSTVSLPFSSGYSYSLAVNGGGQSCSSPFINFTINSTQDIGASMQGNYVDYNNDGFTNVGDIISYQITIINDTCDPITNIYLESNNLNLNGGPIISLAPNSFDNTTFTGFYVLTQQDINSGSVNNTIVANGTLNGNQIVNDYTITTALDIDDGIKLNAFIDLNNNGTQENFEQNATIGSFYYQINNGVNHTITAPNGMHFLYESNASNLYTIGYTINSNNTDYYTISNSSYSNISVTNGSGITTYNFPITQIPHIDLAVYLSPIAGPIPGFPYGNNILFKNLGNQTIASGTITFNVNNVVTTTTYPVGAIPNATGFTYNFTNLLPNEQRSFYVLFQLPTIPTVSIGQLLTNSVSITIPAGDANTSNNSASLTQDIRASWDPNDKQEHHGGQIEFADFTSNDYLTYTIRFENTGNANAINVSVEDTLDAKLDESSIQMITASHNYVLDRVGSNLTWRFDGINLPPSVPETQIGHGFITFQIKPKAGYAVGDIIPNTAYIYFDFNPAIITNTCKTEFVETLSNSDFAFSNLNFFPNPVKNSLTISNESLINSIEITSILGQNILSQKVTSLQTEIDLSELSTGIYFVKVTSKGQEKTIKIIKN